jgi:hypothetical protein
MLSRAKTNSLSSGCWGCPVCGGHRYDQILNKQRRANEKRMWIKEASDGR